MELRAFGVQLLAVLGLVAMNAVGALAVLFLFVLEPRGFGASTAARSAAVVADAASRPSKVAAASEFAAAVAMDAAAALALLLLCRGKSTL